MQNKKRPLIKALSWTVLDSIVTFTVAYLFTRQILISLEVATISSTLEIIVYFLHERGWERIKYGKF